MYEYPGLSILIIIMQLDEFLYLSPAIETTIEKYAFYAKI